jgi:hypothetical protein
MTYCYHPTVNDDGDYQGPRGCGGKCLSCGGRCLTNDVFPLEQGPKESGSCGWWYEPASIVERETVMNNGTWQVGVSFRKDGMADPESGEYKFTFN